MEFIYNISGKVVCMADFIIVIVLASIVGAAIIYIVKEKKRGVQCIGCPAAGECARKRNGQCNCHTETNEA